MKVSFFFSCFMIMIYILASCSADYKGNVVYLIKQKIQQQSEKYCTTLLINSVKKSGLTRITIDDFLIHTGCLKFLQNIILYEYGSCFKTENCDDKDKGWFWTKSDCAESCADKFNIPTINNNSMTFQELLYSYVNKGAFPIFQVSKMEAMVGKGAIIKVHPDGEVQ